MAKLENWKYIKYSSNPYKAPELTTFKLAGQVYGQEGRVDGASIITSEVVDLDTTARTAKTASGTKYELGEPDPDWVEWCTNEGFILSDFDK